MPTDFLLFQVNGHQELAAPIAQSFRQFCLESNFGLIFDRAALTDDGTEIYLYAKLTSRMMIDADDCPALQGLFHKASGTVSRVSRLQLKLKPLAGSCLEIPKFHYVVETDTDDNWFEEIEKWYDEEHMLGLAAVPGCVSAMRFVNLDAKIEPNDNRPRSFACYDLTDKDVLGSPPWLAVRHTKWSDVARPHFKNTKRTMMTVIDVS